MTQYKAFIDSDNKLHYISLTPNGKHIGGMLGSIGANAILVKCDKCGCKYYNSCDTCYYNTIIEHTKEEIDKLYAAKLASDNELADAMIIVNYLNKK
jgi:hypothetical protein